MEFEEKELNDLFKHHVGDRREGFNAQVAKATEDWRTLQDLLRLNHVPEFICHTSDVECVLWRTHKDKKYLSYQSYDNDPVHILEASADVRLSLAPDIEKIIMKAGESCQGGW